MRPFGVEFECFLPENTTMPQCAVAVSARLGNMACRAESWGHQTRDWWKIVTDGSLGNYTSGMELVSPPLNGLVGMNHVATACSALTDFGCTVNKKCGFHVHVGVEGARDSFFKRLLELYLAFEKVIDNMMPPSRRDNVNNYCRSLANGMVTTTKIKQARDFNALLSLYRGRGQDLSKYHKINLNAYEKYKTVEFRQHSGTIDAVKANNWIHICQKMVEFAMSDSPLPLIGEVRNNARAYTKAWKVGEMLLRPEGVTNAEVCTELGWQSAYVPEFAKAAGIEYRTMRTGHGIRYFAVRSNIEPNIENFVRIIGIENLRDYIESRTSNLAGAISWAA